MSRQTHWNKSQSLIEQKLQFFFFFLFLFVIKILLHIIVITDIWKWSVILYITLNLISLGACNDDASISSIPFKICVRREAFTSSFDDNEKSLLAFGLVVEREQWKWTADRILKSCIVYKAHYVLFPYDFSHRLFSYEDGDQIS